MSNVRDSTCSAFRSRGSSWSAFQTSTSSNMNISNSRSSRFKSHIQSDDQTKAGWCKSCCHSVMLNLRREPVNALGLPLWWAASAGCMALAEVVAYLPLRTPSCLLAPLSVALYVYGLIYEEDGRKVWFDIDNQLLIVIDDFVLLCTISCGLIALGMRSPSFYKATWFFCFCNCGFYVFMICSEVLPTADYYSRLIELGLLCLWISLAALEHIRGVSLPAMFGYPSRPFEAYLGLTSWIRVYCFMIVLSNCFIKFRFGEVIFPAILAAIFSCPLTFRVILASNTCFWGGPSWQNLALPFLAGLPFKGADRRLYFFSKLSIPACVQAVVPDVPLVGSYDPSVSGRLRALTSFIGGAAFNVESVHYLVSSLADPHTKNARGFSVLSVAIEQNNVPIVEYLLRVERAREHINQFDPNDNTPLHAATKLGLTEVVRLLKSAGADPTILDQSGSTPSMYVEPRDADEQDSWKALVSKLPELPEKSGLYEQLWHPAFEQYRDNRISKIVHECIIDLLQESVSKHEGLSKARVRSLRRALTATKAPRFLGDADWKKNGDEVAIDFFRKVSETAKGFNVQLNQVRDKLIAEKDGFFKQVCKLGKGNSGPLHIIQNDERTITDFSRMQRKDSPTPSPWTQEEIDHKIKLSQYVAEGLPMWVQKRSLSGALRALAVNGVVRSADEFVALLSGQHVYFKGMCYANYFKDIDDDTFWIALYVMYDVGKTDKVLTDFQSVLKTAIFDNLENATFNNDAKAVGYLYAPVKGFDRTMEKIIADWKDWKKDHPSLDPGKHFDCYCKIAADVKDKARNSFVCHSSEQLFRVWEALKQLGDDGNDVFLVRPGVRFRLRSLQYRSMFDDEPKKPEDDGYADIKFWILAECLFGEDGDKHDVERAFVTETQILLSEYMDVKERMHVAYEVVRGSFGYYDKTAGQDLATLPQTKAEWNSNLYDARKESPRRDVIVPPVILGNTSPAIPGQTEIEIIEC